MKKLLITGILGIMLAAFTTVYADYQLGTDADTLTVSGTSGAYENVTVMLLDSDVMECYDADTAKTKYLSVVNDGGKVTENWVFLFESTEANADGKWSYTLALDGIEKKNLTLLTNKEDCEYIPYGSVDFRTNLIPDLQTESKKGIEELSDMIENNIGYISTEVLRYKNLKNKESVAKYVQAEILKLEQSVDALAVLQSAMDKAIIIASVSEGKVSDFDTAMSVYAYDTELAKGITDAGKSKIVELLSGKAYDDKAAYISAAKIQLALQTFNYNKNTSADNLANVLTSVNSYLNLNLSGYNGLTADADRSNAAQQLALKKCESISTAQSSLNTIVANLTGGGSGNGNGNGYTGGGGFGGGSGAGAGRVDGTAYSGGMQSGISEEYLQEQKYIYPDLRDAEWACDAVIYLSERNIISGYEDGSFMPNNAITRAEFIKLITETFFADAKYDIEEAFPDVSAEDWFAKYVSIAYKEGIITGNENGMFMPDEEISRQDMAVMIYRAAEGYKLFEDAVDFEAFADDAQISDYAKNAVYCLKSNNIVNGVGDNMFAPTDSTNRASAAQIIYNMMISVK